MEIVAKRINDSISTSQINELDRMVAVYTRIKDILLQLKKDKVETAYMQRISMAKNVPDTYFITVPEGTDTQMEKSKTLPNVVSVEKYKNGKGFDIYPKLTL